MPTDVHKLIAEYEQWRLFDEAVANLHEARTARDVARLLRSAGVRGVRRSGCACPIANYLKRESGADSVEVFGGSVRMYIGLTTGWVVARQSREMRHFIWLFDRGFFPSIRAR